MQCFYNYPSNFKHLINKNNEQNHKFVIDFIKKTLQYDGI